jgi:hypothetical protein
MEVSKKKLPFDPAMPLLGLHLKELLPSRKMGSFSPADKEL